MNLQPINTGLEIGTKFLGKEVAYFLGMLLADEQLKWKGNIYWQSSVRHNPQYASKIQIENHLVYIRNIASVLDKSNITQLSEFYQQQNIPIIKFNSGKKGIVTLFRQTVDAYSIHDLVRDIHVPLMNSSLEVQKAFLIGVFDGRGSYDKGANFVVVDYDDLRTKDLIIEILEKLNIDMNINSSQQGRARKGTTLAPRKKQIRIRHEKFLEILGFISEVKYENATRNISPNYKKVNCNLLPGVKCIEKI